MGFWRNKISIFMIIVTTALCLVSMGIAIRVSLVLINKKDQMVKRIHVEQQIEDSKDAKLVSTEKMQKRAFYFNGRQYEGMSAFEGDKNAFFVPVDVLLSKIGIKFKWYSSDDMMGFDIASKKVLLRLGESKVLLGKENIEMSWAPAASKNHVLVPVEMFAHLDGFTVDVQPDRNTVFINYYPEYRSRVDALILMRLVDGKTMISGITDNKSLWNREEGLTMVETIEASPAGADFLIRSNGRIYLAKMGNHSNPRSLKIPPSATWSADGKYLHWINADKKTSFVYDIKGNTTENIGDYYFRIKENHAGEKTAFAADLLYDYRKERRYKRISFASTGNEGSYTLIERRGKTVIEGYTVYSPDRKKILYRKTGKGYYTANIDGTNAVLLGDAVEARWISGSKIYMRTYANDTFLVTSDGEEKERITGKWYSVGQTPEGDMFYVGKNMLYAEKDGEEREIMQLPWECDRLYPLSANGPYISVSKADNSISYIEDNNIEKICEYDLLLKYDEGKNADGSDDTSITGSPDGKRAAVLIKQDGYVTVNVVGEDQSESREIVLDYPLYDNSISDDFSWKWVTNRSLFLYTPKRAWIIDFEGQAKIFEWREEEGRIIKGILNQ